MDKNENIALAEEQLDADLMGAIARGWCVPECSDIEMDSKLAFAIGREVAEYLARQAQAEPVATEDINRMWDKAIEAESIANQLRREKEGLLAALRAVAEAPSQAVSIADTALRNYE